MDVLSERSLGQGVQVSIVVGQNNETLQGSMAENLLGQDVSTSLVQGHSARSMGRVVMLIASRMGLDTTSCTNLGCRVLDTYGVHDSLAISWHG